MNKITTSILAGVALAAIAAAPASASNGIFKNLTSPLPASFNFTQPGYTSYSLTDAPVSYTTGTGTGAVSSSGLLTIKGGTLVAGTSYSYTGGSFKFTPDAGQTVTSTFTDFGSSNVNVFNGFYAIQNIGGKLSNGDQIQLTYSPVPEASTVISFGALLALGGLAVLRRKSVARAS